MNKQIANVHFQVLVKDGTITVSKRLMGKNRNAIRSQVNQTAKTIIKEMKAGQIVLTRGTNPVFEWDQP